MEAKGGRFGNF